MSNALSERTTFGIGGPARRLLTAYTADELIDLTGRALVLGGGSDVLVSDSGYDGTVVINRYGGIAVDGLTVTVGSGAMLPTLSHYLAGKGLSGLEWTAGIPGTVGGAVRMNAGAFGSCIVDRLLYADVIRGGKLMRQDAKALGLGYRSSALTDADTVISAAFVLERAAPAAVLGRIKRLAAMRALRQPRGRSAGSVFRNPDGVSAAKLIDGAGLKGLRVGGAQISPQHANFIVNTGGATARDVCTLINTVKAVIKSRGVELHEEIIYIGDFD